MWRMAAPTFMCGRGYARATVLFCLPEGDSLLMLLQITTHLRSRGSYLLKYSIGLTQHFFLTATGSSNLRA